MGNCHPWPLGWKTAPGCLLSSVCPCVCVFCRTGGRGTPDCGCQAVRLRAGPETRHGPALPGALHEVLEHHILELPRPRILHRSVSRTKKLLLIQLHWNRRWKNKKKVFLPSSCLYGF